MTAPRTPKGGANIVPMRPDCQPAVPSEPAPAVAAAPSTAIDTHLVSLGCAAAAQISDLTSSALRLVQQGGHEDEAALELMLGRIERLSAVLSTVLDRGSGDISWVEETMNMGAKS